MTIQLPRYLGTASHRPTLADIVPGYTCEPGAISKREAVRYIVGDRMRADVARGKGRNAERRHRQIVAANQARSDAEQNRAAKAAARAAFWAEQLARYSVKFGDAASADWTEADHEEINKGKALDRAGAHPFLR